MGVLMTAVNIGETIPSFYIFDTPAEIEENQKFSLSWMSGVPGVRGVFGWGHARDYAPGCAVTTNGSMEEHFFEQWLGHSIYPLYPDMSKELVYDAAGEFVSGPVILKIDMGPGRLSSQGENLEMRKRAAERGLLIFPGLQNTTAAIQELDIAEEPLWPRPRPPRLPPLPTTSHLPPPRSLPGP